MMKKPFLLFLSLVLVSSAAMAVTESEEAFGEEVSASPLGIVGQWQVLAIMSLLLSGILVAIAYMVGTGFEMPEVKAWASNEFVQIIANALIIVSLIVTIAFIDGLVLAIAAGSGLNVAACYVGGQGCLQETAIMYLEDYQETAQEGARSVLQQNVWANRAANIRLGFYCTTAFLPLFCLQAGGTSTILGHYVLDVDFYSIIFEYYTNLLSSMEAQRFFVTEISFKMGPVILAIGIVARTFFFTRKMGGLLIAVAAGVMFFFPGMYIFDWVTLDMAVNGDKLLDEEEVSCPAECSIAAPLAYYSGGVLMAPQDVYGAFSAADADFAAQIVDGSLASRTGSNPESPANGQLVVSCFAGDYANCPRECRELPYPAAGGGCADVNAQIACSALPAECKIVRFVDTSAPQFDNDEYNRCPASCKVVPPLRSNCNADIDDDGDTDACLASRFDCRMAKRNNLDWRPSTVDVEGSNYFECVLASQCPASLTASDSCVWVVPDSGRCDELCVECPAECRIRDAALSDLPAQCKNEDEDALSAACSACITNYDSCTVGMNDITSLNPPAGQCGSCPAHRRIIYSTLPNEYITGGCDIEACSRDYRVAIPRNTCESCLFTEESYVYDPPINTQCSEQCAPSGNVPTKKPGEYTKIGAEGLVGKPEVQNVAKLLVPVYVLPLFNIVATLVFIKGLSQILGGDIEIPGITKVF
jgi:hypothetical protein